MDYYRSASVYATASLHEGFGVPPVEAMACALPVVASRAAAHTTVIGDAGLLTEPGNAADLAANIVAVLTDEALRVDLVRRGLERAREFSLERYDSDWEKIVAEVTSGLPMKPMRDVSEKRVAANIARVPRPRAHPQMAVAPPIQHLAASY